MFVLVTAGGGTQATVEDAGNLKQLHAEDEVIGAFKSQQDAFKTA